MVIENLDSSGSSRTLRRATYCSSMMALFQQCEPLQFGIGLGERQYRRIARRDRLDLGVAQFLTADILGAAGGIIARNNLHL